MYFIPMGYERSYDQISNLLQEKLEQIIPPDGKRHVSPHTLDMFSLWIVMTALIPPSNADYYASLPITEEAKGWLNSILLQNNQFNLLHKALVYKGDDLSVVGFDSKREKILKDNTEHITNEYNLGVGERKFSLYEGSAGYLPSDAIVLLSKAVQVKPDECFSALELLDILENQIKHGFDFEETRNAIVTALRENNKEKKKMGQPQYSIKIPEFPTTKALFDLVKNYFNLLVNHELKLAAEAIKTKEDLRKDLEKYLNHVKVLLMGGKVKEEHRGAMDKGLSADETFMKEQEKQFLLETDSMKFRSDLLGKCAKAADKFTGEALIDEVFKDQIPKIEAKLAHENSTKTTEFISDVRMLIDNAWNIEAVTSKEVDKERNRRLVNGIEKLHKAGYCNDCIRKIFASLKI